MLKNNESKNLKDYDSLLDKISKLKSRSETLEEQIHQYMETIENEITNKARYIIQLQDWTLDKTIYPNTKMNYQCTDNIKMIINEYEFSFSYIFEDKTKLKLLFLYSLDDKRCTIEIKDDQCELKAKLEFFKYVVENFENISDIYFDELCDRFLMYDDTFTDKDDFKKQLAIKVLERTNADIDKSEIVDFLIKDTVVQMINTFSKVKGLEYFYDYEKITRFELCETGFNMESICLELLNDELITIISDFYSNEFVISDLSEFEEESQRFYDWLYKYIEVEDKYKISENEIENYNFYYSREIKPLINQFDNIYENRIKKMVQAINMLHDKDRMFEFEFEQPEVDNSKNICKYSINQNDFEIYYYDYKLEIDKDRYFFNYTCDTSDVLENKLKDFYSLLIESFDNFEKAFFERVSEVINSDDYFLEHINEKSDDNDGDDDLPF